MKIPATKKGVKKCFNRAPQEVRGYFCHLPKLIDQFPYSVSLYYLFANVEYAHNMCLYCSVVKIHQANKTIASNVIQKQHLTREGFDKLFETVIGKKIDNKIADKIRAAEKVRDKAIHGKKVEDKDMRMAITRVLEYAELFNAFVKNTAGFQPFNNNLRGFKGAAKSLPSITTRWLLKGLGFAVA